MLNSGKTLVALCVPMALIVSFVFSGSAIAGGVVHSVHVGSPDYCTSIGDTPGCDANWSVTALQFKDGTVTGQFSDRFSTGEGVHGTVTCLLIIGNEAWISGDAWYFYRGKQGTFTFFVKVVDNGTSEQDPPDQLSGTWGIGPDDTCETVHADYPDFPPLSDVPQGQVKVK
jgi:hypothetical protein